MDTPDDLPPEGRLIEEARERLEISQNQAAERAGMSGTRWRQIVKGEVSTMTSSRGLGTIARMAKVVSVTAEQMEAAGRADVAEKIGRPADGFEEKISAAHAMLDELEGDPGLQDRLRKILSAGSGHRMEPDNSDEAGSAGHG